MASRSSIGAVRCSCQAGERQHRQPLHQPGEEVEGGRAVPDEHARAQGDRLGKAVEQQVLDLAAALEVLRAARAVLVGDDAAEVDDPPHVVVPGVPDDLLGGGALRLAEGGAGVHRVDEEVDDVDALHRLVEALAALGVPLDDVDVQAVLELAPVTHERADAVAVCEQLGDQAAADVAAGPGDQDAERGGGTGDGHAANLAGPRP